MKTPPDPIPVVLFAYARPGHLARTLAGLRADAVPLIYAFADGARGAADAAAVAETRALLRGIDWCEVRLTERTENLGLGRNVLAGASAVAAAHAAFIGWEDDLLCVPGTYAWLCAALRRYAGDPRVMSVTGWTHPRIAPAAPGASPYFDARAESWSWGTWARAWRGMNDETALEKMAAGERRGLDPAACGGDLPAQAAAEAARNLWAARWVYHHLLHDGLCVRPPWSMVEHAGFDALATNAPEPCGWAQAALRAAPPVPETWPGPQEDRDARRRWRASHPAGWRAWWRRVSARVRRLAGRA